MIVITMAVLCFLLKLLCCWYIEAMTYLLISSLLEGFQLTEGGLPLSPPQMPPCVVGRLGRGTKESAQGDDGKGKETERPSFPSSHRPLRACYFSIIAQYFNRDHTQRQPRRRRNGLSLPFQLWVPRWETPTTETEPTSSLEPKRFEGIWSFG